METPEHIQIYRDGLTRLGYGSPFYEPDLGRFEHVQIGDVGYIAPYRTSPSRFQCVLLAHNLKSIYSTFLMVSSHFQKTSKSGIRELTCPVAFTECTLKLINKMVLIFKGMFTWPRIACTAC